MDPKLFYIFTISTIIIPNSNSQKFIGMKPCPAVFSRFTDHTDELLGDWHLTLLILDKTEEEFEERSLCIKGRLLKLNNTELVQIWKLKLPEILHQDETEIDFPTTIVSPGIWLVRSPLGGEFKGTIIDSDGSSYLLIMYCGWANDKSAHVMTIAMSRNYVVTPKQKLQFLSLLTKNGYDSFENKIISWSDC